MAYRHIFLSFMALLPFLPLQAAEVSGISLSGSVDGTYTVNFNDPVNRANALRVFDTEHNDFNINLVDLIIQKPAEGAGTAGFRVDLTAGEDPAVFQAAGFNDGDNLEVEQAFINYIVPVGKGLTLTMGKFVTNHGAEVIESADNINTSRSFLFGFAIPFTHTGVLASYPFTDQVTGTLGFVNGWDNVDDNNNGKSIHGMVKVVPHEKYNGALSFTFGPEQTAQEAEDRWLIDIVFTATPIDKWTFVLNGDFAGEEKAGVGSAAGQDASWVGGALYAKYDINPKWYAAGRIELFNDDEGARTGTVDNNLWEITLTASYKPVESFETRLEFRHDDSDQNVFADDTAVGAEDSQDTVSLETIYRY